MDANYSKSYSEMNLENKSDSNVENNSNIHKNDEFAITRERLSQNLPGLPNLNSDSNEEDSSDDQVMKKEGNHNLFYWMILGPTEFF